jgi:hypothetical protein
MAEAQAVSKNTVVTAADRRALANPFIPEGCLSHAIDSGGSGRFAYLIRHTRARNALIWITLQTLRK